MKLHNLRDFIAVAKAGSIHQAARDLGLSQPAVTKSIRQLEKVLGTPLFERSARGVALNAMGRKFLMRAEVAANELSRGRDELAQSMNGQGGQVALAVSGTPSLLFLPYALKTFRRRYPLAQVRIIEGLLPVMLPELREGKLDFVIAPKPVKALGKEFAIKSVFRHRRVVVGRRNHPLQDATSLSDLLDAEWVSTGAAGPRKVELDDVFRSRGLRVPKADVQCESPFALISLIANTDLLALLPEQWVQAPVTAQFLTKLPIDESINCPDLCMIRREGLPLTPAAETFSDALLREAEHHQSQAFSGA